MYGLFILTLASCLVCVTQLITNIQEEDNRSSDFELLFLSPGIYLLVLCIFAIPSFKWLVIFESIALISCVFQGILFTQAGYEMQKSWMKLPGTFVGSIGFFHLT